ncbi:hypothetical protein LguiB_034201 [Lonicera macranthoides]
MDIISQLLDQVAPVPAPQSVFVGAQHLHYVPRSCTNIAVVTMRWYSGMNNNRHVTNSTINITSMAVLVVLKGLARSATELSN